MSKFFKHDLALVESDMVGEGTRIWAFAHVMKGSIIGKNCNIGDHCFIESGAVVGNEVTIKNGVSVWDKVIIEDSVFIGPNVALTNDLFPRSRNQEWEVVQTLIKIGASIGANSTIICGIEIGEYSMIGAGSVVSRSISPYTLVYGNPAEFKAYICQCTNKLIFEKKDESTCSICGKKYVKSSGIVNYAPGNQ
jgi:acetyltransferase-like isoleucine patch superfamily enzyme